MLNFFEKRITERFQGVGFQAGTGWARVPVPPAVADKDKPVGRTRRFRRVATRVARWAGVALITTQPAWSDAMELLDHRDGMLRLGVPYSPASQIQRDREQAEAEARAREQAAPSLRPAPSVRADPPVLPIEAACEVIDRVELKVPDALPAAVRRAGASALPQDPFAFAASWLDAYRGQCIGKRGVNEVAYGFSRLLLERGYLTTRVQIPSEDVPAHVFQLILVPGLIHEIRFADGEQRASWRTAFSVRPGDLLRLRDLEQALVQFKQVAGQDADVQIRPTDDPGLSDIVITLKRERPWHVTAIVDNSGIDATGKLQGTLAASIDNPFGLNDRFSGAYTHDLTVDQPGRMSTAWNTYYALPFGFWDTSFTAYGSRYHHRLAARHHTYSTSGESTVLEWQLTRNLMRTNASTLALQLRLGRRFARSYIEDIEIRTQRRNNTYVQWGLAGRLYAGQAQFDTLLAIRNGLPKFGAQTSHGGDDGLTYQYRMALLDTNVSVPVSLGGRTLMYTTALHGQWTRDRLYQVDQAAIGTRWTVRGFDGEQMLSGDRGYYWRNDLAMAIGRSAHSVYAGVDYGQVFGPSTSLLAGTRLAGAVIGVRGMAGRHAGRSRTAVAAAPAIASGSGASMAPGPRVPMAPAVANASARASSDEGSLGVPGVLSYDLFAGTPLLKPHGFTTAQLTVGFQLSYQY